MNEKAREARLAAMIANRETELQRSYDAAMADYHRIGREMQVLAAQAEQAWKRAQKCYSRAIELDCAEILVPVKST